MNLLRIIFGLLVTAMCSVAGQSADAPIVAVKTQLSSLETALAMFRVDVGRYPTTSEGLNALMKCPTSMPVGLWKGPYTREFMLKDRWKHEFMFRCPGLHNTNGFDLASCGFDGISKSQGSDLDDINNWDPKSPYGRNPDLRPFWACMVLIGCAVVVVLFKCRKQRAATAS